ncbi:MAG TPA: glycosyltransferase [Vicinamibacterales bacterium]|nr:glycosyltransferase [Vicinamibacterales bacterium]
MKIAIVVQRYGADINGGAELHARYVAERLAPHADVRVLTTCARDYISWRNEWPAGLDTVDGIPVERFPVARERDLVDFRDRSALVFKHAHSLHDELRWLESQGPYSPSLIARLARAAAECDFIVLFSIRYHHAYQGARIAPHKAVLVPTAEREASLGLSMFPPVFRGVRAIMYNSYEEQALVNTLSSNAHVPGVVVGIGSEIPDRVFPQRVRAAYDLRNPFIVYVGRIDANKGCADLFRNFLDYVDRSGSALDLVLIGTAVLPIPSHPRIRHLGFVSDQDKFDVIAASELLVMPSPYESLSMVALEAWALGKPVLASARCDVLVGQCLRSNAGLYYNDAAEFSAALDTLLSDSKTSSALGRHGRTYYEQHYSWPVIEQKYLEMFDRLRRSPAASVMEPLPGWLARRRRTAAAAEVVVNRLPAGPAVASRSPRAPEPAARTTVETP